MHNKRKTVIFLIMCSVIVYGNSLNNSFVFDDAVVIVDNDFVNTFKNVSKLFSADYLRYSGEFTYRPLVTLSYFLDYKIWADDAFGFHLTSLVLHILNVILVYFLTSLILKNGLISLLSALFFCVHSVHSEAVDCIAFREDMLCSLFFLLSLLLYIEFTRKSNIAFYLLSIGSFILSLLSKEMAFTLPLVIVLYDIYREDSCSGSAGKGLGSKVVHVSAKLLRHIKGRAKFYIAYLLIAAAFSYLRFFVIFTPFERTVRYPGGSFYTNILNMLRVVAYYMRLLVIPYPLCPMYAFEESETIFDMRVLGAFLVLMLLLVFLFHLIKKSRIFLFAAGWFFITLIPVYNIIPIINIVAERYLYIPSLGFCLAVPSLLLMIHSEKLRKCYIVALISLILLYSFFTIRRNCDWRNNISLYKNTLIHFPGNFHLRFNLGHEYLDSGRIEEAIIEFRTVIKHNPEYAKAYNNLGYIYANIKDYKRAEKYWLGSLRIEPGNEDIISNLEKLYNGEYISGRGKPHENH